MKTNCLPKMTAMLLLDRDNVEVGVDVKVLALAGTVAVFMADRQGNSSSSISRNAATYLAQLARRLGLHPTSTQFYRHVYHPQQGSLFGRFDIVWNDMALVNYKFVMLNNLDEGKRLQDWIAKATVVPITYGQTRNLARPTEPQEISPAAGY
ncbi:MAG TPA: hypothetical protein VL987_15245 [Cellvibrio sp.]|jgi:hypothetical protein|nr:hypothetical protein [Cellvibrio sp.]